MGINSEKKLINFLCQEVIKVCHTVLYGWSNVTKFNEKNLYIQRKNYFDSMNYLYIQRNNYIFNKLFIYSTK